LASFIVVCLATGRKSVELDNRLVIDQLSAVSNTALLTLWARAIEAQSADPALVDPTAITFTEQLLPYLKTEADPFYQQLAGNKIPRLLVLVLALRAAYFDQMARNFRQRFPRGIIVNLGAGLDTRFERLDDGKVRVIDLDLPPVISLKRQLSSPHPRHELMAASVLDFRWMDALDRYADPRFLFIAEGLLMYFPEHEVKHLVVTLANRFPGSEFAADVFHARWLRPPWREWVTYKLQRQLKFGPEATFRFGLDSPKGMEKWHPHIHFLGEWSFLDAPERKLGILRWFRHLRLLRHIQYMVHYQLG
jgi:methyltransferase (TIGR00027 family)